MRDLSAGYANMLPWFKSSFFHFFLFFFFLITRNTKNALIEAVRASANCEFDVLICELHGTPIPAPILTTKILGPYGTFEHNRNNVSREPLRSETSLPIGFRAHSRFPTWDAMRSPYRVTASDSRRDPFARSPRRRIP